MLVPLPNIEARQVYLKYHDIHHLVAGYSVGRIGEGQMSSWELGTGSFFVSLSVGFMNLVALSTGFLLRPKRMWRAFLRGCRSRNIYTRKQRDRVEKEHWKSVALLREDIVDVRGGGFKPLRLLEFSIYLSVSLLIHAVVVLPAILARSVMLRVRGSDAFRSVRHQDLY